MFHFSVLDAGLKIITDLHWSQNKPQVVQKIASPEV